MIPDLALTVPTTQNGGISSDGRTITLHLRHGVTWSDGAPLTAADWLFTYHAVLNPRNNTKLELRLGHDRVCVGARSIHARHSSEEAQRCGARHPRDGRRGISAAARAPARDASGYQSRAVQQRADLERSVPLASLESRRVARSSFRTRTIGVARQNSKS